MKDHATITPTKIQGHKTAAFRIGFNWDYAIEFIKEEIDHREQGCYLSQAEADAIFEKINLLRKEGRSHLFDYAAGNLWHLFSLLAIDGVTVGKVALFDLLTWARSEAVLLPIPSTDYLLVDHITEQEEFQKKGQELSKKINPRILGVINPKGGYFTTKRAREEARAAFEKFLDCVQVVYFVVSSDGMDEQYKNGALLEVIQSSALAIGRLEEWTERAEEAATAGAKGIVKTALDQVSEKMVKTATVLLDYSKAPEKTIKARLAIEGDCDDKTAARWLKKFRENLTEEARERHFAEAKRRKEMRIAQDKN